MRTNDQLGMLRAMVEGDFEWHERLAHLLHASGALDGYGEVIGAAFFLAVRAQFPQRYCAEDVIRLVADVRAQFDLTGDQLDPRAAELTVRCALGEHGQLADVADATVVQTQVVITAYLAWKGRLGDPDLFMGKVQALLAEWAEPDEVICSGA
jgi:hypothetical protein